jgi:hypothetical protein
LVWVLQWDKSAATPATFAISYSASSLTMRFIFSKRLSGWPMPPAAPSTATFLQGTINGGSVKGGGVAARPVTGTRASIALDAKTGSECLSKPRWAHLASITAWLREALTTCWRDATSRCSARMLDCCPIAFMPLKVAKRCTFALQRDAASLAVAEQGERVLAVAAAMIESSVRKVEGIAERHDVCI